MDALRRSGAGTTAVEQQNSHARLTSKAPAVTPVTAPVVKPPTDGVAAPVRTEALENATRAQIALTGSRVAGDWLDAGSVSRSAFDALVKAFFPQGLQTAPAHPAHTLKPLSGADVSLIGLQNAFFDPKASYPDNLARLKQQGLPRFETLSPTERAHETAFAGEVLEDPEHFVAAAEILANDDRLKASVFEADTLKRLHPPYGVGKRPANEGERQVRAESNHALHPTAVAVARLAFLKKLDALAGLSDEDPKKQVFVTSGGCAAGKGSLTDIVKRQLGDIPFGAVWDAAGEGDALENAWVLEACRARGIRAMFGFAGNDATEKYKDVLERGVVFGRFVDVVTFTNSYVEGTKNMKAFLESPQYQAAVQAGMATAIGVFTGRFDVASLEDPTLPAYPDLRTLGNAGLIGAGDLPEAPDKATVLEASLAELERFVAECRRAGVNVEPVIGGALGLALKFQSEIA